MPETINKFTDNLTGFSKVIAKKIMNGDFAEKVKRISMDYGSAKSKNALNMLVRNTVLAAANAIRLKIMVILIVIVIILAILASVITVTFNGSVAIPIIVAVFLVLIMWTISIIVIKSIANKVSGMIVKSIEGEITKFAVNKGLGVS